MLTILTVSWICHCAVGSHGVGGPGVTSAAVLCCCREEGTMAGGLQVRSPAVPVRFLARPPSLASLRQSRSLARANAVRRRALPSTLAHRWYAGGSITADAEAGVPPLVASTVIKCGCATPKIKLCVPCASAVSLPPPFDKACDKVLVAAMPRQVFRGKNPLTPLTLSQDGFARSPESTLKWHPRGS